MICNDPLGPDGSPQVPRTMGKTRMGLLTGREVVKDGVLAEGLEAPCHDHVLELGRGGVVTFEGNGGKQSNIAFSVLDCDQQGQTP